MFMSSYSSPTKKSQEHIQYYNTLSISSTASTEQIKSAYIAKSKSIEISQNPIAFIQIARAYDTLANADKRRQYDTKGEEGLAANPNISLNDPTNNIFHKSHSLLPKPPPIKSILNVTLEDIYNGNKVSTQVKRTRKCQVCKGTGSRDGATIKYCMVCKGTGESNPYKMSIPSNKQNTLCSACKGKKIVINDENRCSSCHGECIIEESIILSIKVDKGIPNNKIVVLATEGTESIEYENKGDLHMKIKVKKHPVYSRKGADLKMNYEITLLEAISGVKMAIKFLNGKMLQIESHGKIINQNTTMTVANCGLPIYKLANLYGNLFITFWIKLPKSLNATAASILGGFAQAPVIPKAAIQKSMVDFNDSHRNAHSVKEDANGMNDNDPRVEEEFTSFFR